MADIDELLKGSFERLAEPANSAGVADAIRSRVAAGDAGTSVAGGTAPGWSGAARPAWFWPLIGTVSTLAVTVAILIGLLVTGGPAVPSVVTPSATPTESPATTPTPTPIPTPTPTPTPEPPPPAPPPAPPAPVDQTIPLIAAAGWSPATVYGTASAPYCESTSEISVTASDPSGIASVTASTSFPGSQAVLVGSGGDTYTFRFSGTYQSGPDAVVTVTFRATDGIGNSATTSRTLTLRSSDACIVIF